VTSPPSASRGDVAWDDAPVMLAVFDTQGHLLTCNRTFTEFTGRDRSSLQGTGWQDLLVDEDAAESRALFAAGDEFDVERRVRRWDGRVRWASLRGAPRDDGLITVAGFDIHESHHAAHETAILAALGEALNRSLDLDCLLDRVAELVVRELADLCTLAVREDVGGLRRAALRHADQGRARSPSADVDWSLEPAAGSGMAQVMRTGAVVYRPIVDAPASDEPSPAVPSERVPDGTRSLIVVPIAVDGDVFGALALLSWSRLFTPDDVTVAQEVGRRCGLAVDHATSYRRSEDARARLTLLASLGEQLAATLDPEEALRTIVRGVVPAFADAATIELLDDPVADSNDTELVIAAREICHVDAPRAAALRAEYLDELIIGLEDDSAAARAVRTRQPVLIEDLGPADGGRPSRRRNGHRAPEALGATSLLAVPLLERDHVLGAITLTFTDSGRRYAAGDVPLALDLARRSTLAVERARTYYQERRIAETLQRSMLPEALPEVANVGFCANYLPGGRVDVGGDWYDVIPLQGGRLGLAIGDVAGHGIRAATVMGQLRHALRAFASDHMDAGVVATRLNRFVFEQGPADMATLCYAVLDPGHGALDIACAGHVPPLLLSPTGDVSYFHSRPEPPIGADTASVYDSSFLRLEPGSTFVLYTDGLIERRRESLDDGLARLATEAGLAPDPLDELCDHLVARLLDASRRDDDVALLAVRYLGAEHGRVTIRRPARASELASVRRVLRARLEAAGLRSEQVGVIAVAVSEAATNAIEHAYGPMEGWFEVEADVGSDAVEVTVRDGGRWRSKARGGGGRGLALIGRLMDEFELRRTPTGTEVWMRRVLHHDAVGEGIQP
jgi:PAS domain S-box-containing protein